MKQLILSIGFCFFMVGSLFAQSSGFDVNVNSAQVFGLEYRVNQNFSFGARLDNGKLEGASVTPLIKYQIMHFSDASCYIGVGLKGLDPVNDVSIPLGVRVTPFGASSGLGFTIELDNIIGDDYYLRPSIGLSYQFGK